MPQLAARDPWTIGKTAAVVEEMADVDLIVPAVNVHQQGDFSGAMMRTESRQHQVGIAGHAGRSVCLVQPKYRL